MARDWYVRRDGGTIHGPYTVSQLRGLVAIDKPRQTDSVRKGENGGWVPAANVQEILAEGDGREVPAEAFRGTEPPRKFPLPPQPGLTKADEVVILEPSGSTNGRLCPCPDCGKQVSKSAVSCPSCGGKLKTPETAIQRRAFKTIAICLMLGGIGVGITFFSAANSLGRSASLLTSLMKRNEDYLRLAESSPLYSRSITYWKHFGEYGEAFSTVAFAFGWLTILLSIASGCLLFHRADR
jgi:hypothetical protein